MSQRIAKVESQVQQMVAAGLLEYLDRGVAAIVTVTRVDAAPDLRHAIVWLGVLGDQTGQEKILAQVLEVKVELQQAVAKRSTAKFVPRLTFKLDTGGEHAADIDLLLRQL